MSGLFLFVKCFSNRCQKCTLNILHSSIECAQNINAHAKQFEAVGAVDFMTEIFNKHDSLLREKVTDDDSSIRSVLKHNNKELFLAKLIPEWPKYDNGSLKPDNGKLLINHVPSNFFLDRNHRVRTIARELFTLGRKKLGDCIGTTHNTERMKRNLSYAIRFNCSKSLEELKTGMKSVLEHHFNNHEYCGSWCQYKGESVEEIKMLNKKYRDKKFIQIIIQSACLYLKSVWLRLGMYIILTILIWMRDSIDWFGIFSKGQKLQ